MRARAGKCECAMCVQVLVLKQQEQQERHELELVLASMADKRTAIEHAMVLSRARGRRIGRCPAAVVLTQGRRGVDRRRGGTDVGVEEVDVGRRSSRSDVDEEEVPEQIGRASCRERVYVLV